MGLTNDKNQIFNLSFILIGIGIIVMISFVFVMIFNLIPESSVNTIPSSSTSYILANNNSSQTLISGESIKSFTSTAHNQTWLDFDGIDNNVVNTYNLEDTTSLSFWYKNSSVDWQHVVNSSGTTYVNGSTNTPLIFPIFYNGSDYLIGQIDGSTFFNGSIDDVRVFNYSLTSTEVGAIYNEGRI